LSIPSAQALNKVLSLDGDGDYVKIIDSPILNSLDTQITIEAWIRCDKFNGGHSSIIYKGDKHEPGDVHRSFALWPHPDGHIHFTSASDDGVYYTFDSPRNSIPFYTWCHIAGVIDAVNQEMKILINGNEVASRDYGDSIRTSLLPLKIGLGDCCHYFSGYIDEVRIWNVARTQQEIQENMNQPLENPELLENLIGYWNFDSGYPNDLSQYHNDGQLKGDANILDTIYVSINGNDITGDGTIDNPYRTIQKGIDETRRNDIVQVLPGIYEERINLYSDLVVLGSDAENTTITAASGNIVMAHDVHKVSLSGFTLDGKESADSGVAITGNSTVNIFNNHIIGAKTGIWCFDMSAPIIEYNTIAENAEHGIVCQTATTARIQENVIRDNNQNGIFSVGSGSPTIHENNIAKNHWGIMTGGTSTPTITENHITSNSAGVWFRESSVAKLYHNTIELNQAEGIVCSCNAQIVGNAISYNQAGFYCNDVSNPFISGNLIHSNRGVALYATHSSVPKLIQNIIRNNGGGIAFDMSAQPTIGGSLINANTIIDNGGWAISHSTDNIINATYNYWGTTDESEIAAMMIGEGITIFKPFINTLDEIIADASGDGTISALDAALILQYVVGLIDEFPATSPIGQVAQKYVAGEITVEQLDKILQQWGYPSVFKMLGYENQLLQNYPNPFNPETWIPFKLAQNAPVTISIYDTRGQLIRSIVLGNRNAGIYTTKDKAAYWDGRDSLGQKIAGGIYYYTLQAGNKYKATRKMLIVK